MNRKVRTFLIVSFFYLILFSTGFIIQQEIEKYLTAQINEAMQGIPLKGFPKVAKKLPPEIEAKAVLALKIDKQGNEKIIFEKNLNELLPIASITKLMTALIVFEEGFDLEKKVTISQKAAQQENSPFGALETNQKFKINKLLELMLVYSSNDAAWALSEVIGTEKFIQKMNEKAKNLDLANTNFVNPTGLDSDITNIDNLNYSTVKDLAKLTKYILKKYPQIFEISSKEPYFKLENGILSIFTSHKIIGGKTGYTEKAGGCLLFIFEDEKENQFINIILGAKSEKSRIEEMQKLINWINS